MNSVVAPRIFLAHVEAVTMVRADAQSVFTFLDAHENIAGHMDRPSWAMLGGYMKASLDADGGKREGSVIRVDGKVLGIVITLTEKVIERSPPLRKQWETIGVPRSIVIGDYRMGFEIVPTGDDCRLTVFIDYDLPRTRMGRILGRLFGPAYAQWCLKQIIQAAEKRFERVTWCNHRDSSTPIHD